MADVFISYKHEERGRCAQVAEKLRALGLDVWFDARLESGASFDAEIEQTIYAAKAVLVLWSPLAVKSMWVRNEATIGQRRNVLVSAELAPCTLPVQFTNTQTERLHGSIIADDDPGWINVLRRLSHLTGHPALAPYAGRFAAGDRPQPKRGGGRAVALTAVGLLLAAVAGGGAYAYFTYVRPAPRGVEADAAASAPTSVSVPPAVVTPVVTPLPGNSAPSSGYEVDSLFPELRPAVEAARKARALAEEAVGKVNASIPKAEAAAAAAQAHSSGTFSDDYDIGKHYDGEWSGGTRNGYAIQYFRNANLAKGDWYRGQFKDGQRSGLGVYEYAPAEGQRTLRNIGEWDQGLPNGHGETDLTNGDRLLGELKDGALSGVGVYLHADGRRYEGGFSASEPEGSGVLWTKDGKVASAGIWKKGKLIEPQGIQGPAE
jgi:hypothetical protein